MTDDEVQKSLTDLNVRNIYINMVIMEKITKSWQ